jgi:hypothetical protein
MMGARWQLGYARDGRGGQELQRGGHKVRHDAARGRLTCGRSGFERCGCARRGCAHAPSMAAEGGSATSSSRRSTVRCSEANLRSTVTKRTALTARAGSGAPGLRAASSSSVAVCSSSFWKWNVSALRDTAREGVSGGRCADSASGRTERAAAGAQVVLHVLRPEACEQVGERQERRPEQARETRATRGNAERQRAPEGVAHRDRLLAREAGQQLRVALQQRRHGARVAATAAAARRRHPHGPAEAGSLAVDGVLRGCAGVCETTTRWCCSDRGSGAQPREGSARDSGVTASCHVSSALSLLAPASLSVSGGAVECRRLLLHGGCGLSVERG